MEIAPSTQIRLLSNIPLDNTYKDTIHFAYDADRETYFISHTKHTYTNQMYQRVNKGKLRLKELSDNIYDCNYMMFKNANYINKWFYAFITSIDYINNEVCEINYEIDVMQTWFKKSMMLPCYVEREHSDTDDIGEYLAPEPVDLGDITCKKIETSGHFNNYTAVIAMAREWG